MPKLVANLEDSLDGAHHAAVAITTTDLVSKSAALEVRVHATSSVLTPAASIPQLSHALSSLTSNLT